MYWSYAGGAALTNPVCTIHTNSTKLVTTATSLEGLKRELQIVHLYSHSSTIAAISVEYRSGVG